MKVIARKRNQGKTTQLLYTSATIGQPILVATNAQKNCLKNKARELMLDIPEPLVVHELKTGSKQTILVDNAEFVLNTLLVSMGYEISACTLNLDV